jgi:hypothetical protein
MEKAEKGPKISIGKAEKIVLQVVETALAPDGREYRVVRPVTFENVEVVLEGAPQLCVIRHSAKHSTIYFAGSVESYEVWWL